MSLENSSYMQSKIGNHEKDKIKELLAKRLSNKSSSNIVSNNIHEYDLSFMQRNILTSEEINEDFATYNLISCVEAKGTVDVSAIQKSFDSIINTNSILRTRFIKEKGSFKQVIEKNTEFHINFKDISDEESKDQLVESILKEEVNKKFNFNNPPLLRVNVLKKDTANFVLIITIHHSIADGWSLGILINQLQYYYNLYTNNAKPIIMEERINYIDYCIWKNKMGTKENCKEFWINELNGSPILRLECDKERTTKTAYQGDRIYFSIDNNIVTKLQEFSLEKNITKSNIVLAAYQIVLSKLSSQKDFAIGMATANRDSLLLNNMIGCFINTLPIRTRIDENILVSDYLDKLQAKNFEIMKHKNFDFYHIIDNLDYEKDSRYPSLIQVMYNYENTRKPIMSFNSLDVKLLETQRCNTIFDLVLSIFDEGDSLSGFIEYNAEIYNRERNEKLIGFLKNVLESIMDNYDQKIGDIKLLSQSEEFELISINKKTKIESKAFIKHFEEIADSLGNHRALYYEGQALTYSELNKQSNRLARKLCQITNLNELIGVYLDKSIEAIVSILAIFKSGLTYVPLDPSYPAERIKYIIKDSNLTKIITSCKYKGDDKLNEFNHPNVIYLDDESFTLDQNSENLSMDISLEDVAYIIYTSGSTGTPKGVMVPHRGLYNVALQQNKIFNVSQNSRILQFSSFCFDASIFEIIMALGNGATLYIVDKERVLGNSLAKYINENRITHITIPPSVLALTDYTELKSLEVIISAGEACPQELVNTWSKNRKFFNAYGPTEATIWTTTSQCFEDGTVTIGKPVDNVEIYILDENNNLVPKGTAGQLFIGGIGLCKGYLNSSELNEERFIYKSFSGSEVKRLYASGDMVKLDDNNNLIFLGRMDDQIKIRGFRIEIDEIRSKILDFEGVDDAVISVARNKGIDTLYALVKSKDKSIKSLQVKEYLRERLPVYMVPSIIKIADNIPLTLNGKVDFKTIEKDMYASLVTKENIMRPTNGLQKKLLDIWTEVLGLSSIGVDENFFDIGGHSLTATRLANSVSEIFNIEYTANMVFSHPTILEMEDHIKQLSKTDLPPMERVVREEKIKLSAQQKRIWFIEQMADNKGSYNIVTPISLKGDLDFNKLELSIRQIIKRHEILRVNFHSESGTPYQQINESINFRINNYYLVNLDEEEAKAQIEDIIRSESNRKFNLREESLLRVSLIHLSEKEFVLVISMHHIISDGWSIELFINELSSNYNNLTDTDKKSINLMGDDKQYIDYIYWRDKLDKENRFANQLDYWKETLGNDMSIVSLPTDYERPLTQTSDGDTVELEIDSVLTKEIKEFCLENSITMFMYMLTGFSILLHKLTGNDDIPIGVPIAGRNNKETEKMIGFFINTLVMRCRVHEMEDVIKLIANIKDVSLRAYENQEVPFEDLVEIACPERSLKHNPLVQVMLNVQNPDGIKCDIDNLSAGPYPVIQESTKFEITLYVEEHEGTIKLRLLYNTNLFKEFRALEFLKQFKLIVETVVNNPRQKIKDISIMTDNFSRIIQGKNSQESVAKLTNYQLLDEIVSNSAQRYPNNLAVVDDYDKFTYEELEQLSTKMAMELMNKGLGKGDRVIIYATRSAKLVVSILAVLKIGAAFCILDPSYPKERLKKQVSVVNGKGIIFIVDTYNSNLPEFLNKVEIKLNYAELVRSAKELSYQQIKINRDINDTAYVLFTSGTTGIPNCVQTSHKPVSHFLNWYVKQYDFDDDRVFGMFAGLSHDPLIREIFTPLSVGGKLCINNELSKYNADKILKWIVDKEITEVNITPSLFMLITEGEDNKAPNVKHYFFGGEPLTQKHIRRVNEVSPNAMCTNFYGTTETPQVMGYFDLPPNQNFPLHSIPIKGGIDGVEIYLVNSNNSQAGFGELGEIYIKTSFLSKGYLNDERLNDEKFIKLDEGDGEYKIYKTGDLGRYLDDGSILIEGRKDSQLNIRGHRIEIREIELALVEHKNIRNVVVTTLDHNSIKILVAYIVAKNKENFDLIELKDFLINYIPFNLIPEKFFLVDEIPLTPNGKIDYRKLPKNIYDDKVQITIPRDEVEIKVKEIWEKVLHRGNFGIDDNFFDIGGHSLLLVQVKILIEEEFKVDISILDLFKYHTISQISNYIKKDDSFVNTYVIDKDRARKQKDSFGNFRKRLRK